MLSRLPDELSISFEDVARVSSKGPGCPKKVEDDLKPYLKRN